MNTEPAMILVVDDDPAYRDIITRKITDLLDGAVEVNTIASLKEVAPFLVLNPFTQVMIVDLNLNDGREPAEVIIEAKALAGPRSLIAVSSAYSANVALECAKDGVKFVTKDEIDVMGVGLVRLLSDAICRSIDKSDVASVVSEQLKSILDVCSAMTNKQDEQGEQITALAAEWCEIKPDLKLIRKFKRGVIAAGSIAIAALITSAVTYFFGKATN